MARSGIEKSAVVQARNSLIAMGRYPSIDAIRIELGNTGSKATIHRYLKEIDEEEGPPPGKGLAVSEAIQDLAARLATRLQEEADQRVRDLTRQHQTELADVNDTLAVLRNEFELLRRQNERLTTQLSTEKIAHGNAQTLLQEAKIANAQMAQRILGLEAQLAKDETHRLSLEEKHQQTQQTLIQSQEAAKAQQIEDQRRFDQQIAFFQDELLTARSDAVTSAQTLAQTQHEIISLMTHLEHAHQARQHLETDVARLQEENTRNLALQNQLAGQIAQSNKREGALAEAHQEAVSKLEKSQAMAQRLESELLAANAVLASQEKTLEKLTTLQSVLANQKMTEGPV